MRHAIWVWMLAALLPSVALAAASSPGRGWDPEGSFTPGGVGAPRPMIDPRTGRINPRPDREPSAREKDPLKFVTEDMTTVVADLARLQTDQPVQVKQQRIVQDLDRLIKALEQACSSSASGAGRSGASPTKPLDKSQIVGGPGGSGDLHAPKAGDKNWGDLPAKQREQILQSQTEGFPPGFESVLQSYYRRLAQEQVVGETPTTRPGE